VTAQGVVEAGGVAMAEGDVLGHLAVSTVGEITAALTSEIISDESTSGH